MINNRHGPHPAVSYYRSGAPPGCDIACNDNRLYEVEWERCARAAPVIPKIKDALAALGDCFAVFAVKQFKRRVPIAIGSREYAMYAKRFLCPEGFAALGDCLARFAVKPTAEMNMSYGSMMT